MDHELIQSHAYHLWEKAGRPHGRDADFWHLAQEELSRDGELPPLNGHAPPSPVENEPAAPEPKTKAAKPAAPKPAVKAAAAAVQTEAKAAAPKKKAAPKKPATAPE